MYMNIHPAFVHFPIALLCIYAIIEIIPLARFWPAVQWDAIRRFSLYTGTAFGVAAFLTGVMAEDLVGVPTLVEPHEEAAAVTIALFIILCLVTYFWRGEGSMKYWFTKALALSGLAMLFVTGALGANIVYGSDVDPIVSFVVRILGVQ